MKKADIIGREIPAIFHLKIGETILFYHIFLDKTTVATGVSKPTQVYILDCLTVISLRSIPGWNLLFPLV